ncbi:hypothetical protein HNQ69_000054 [Bartonella callosciuri]|uniref:Uncharacterized protein n=1 Tax=Bartonella callosciuri TaxID=686223 RepID=A0A840NM55_9HYPH|nr:hypothetical protein [Bartonella callosciuri]
MLCRCLEVRYRNDVFIIIYNDESWHRLNPTQTHSKKDLQTKLYPSGFIGNFAMREIPKGWLLCDGKAYVGLIIVICMH